MTSSTFYESSLPRYNAIPEEWQQARQYLTEAFRKIADAVNAREIGWFLDEELLSGKQFIPGSNSQEYRAVFRKVLDFGTLPNATSKTLAHGITVDDRFSLITLYGSATKPTVAYSALPLPYASSTLNNNIEVALDATNVTVTTAIDYSAYTKTYIIIEYIQEL